MVKLKFLSLIFGALLSLPVMSQYCMPQQQFGFMASPYTGGHHQHQALLAHPAAYNPQGYYFPQGNVHLSQPPFFGTGMNCMPMFMPPGGFQTSFGSQAMPQMSPLYGMLPAIGEGIGKLATGFLNRAPSEGQSYSDFLSQRGRDSSSSSSSGGRDFSSFTSPNRSGGPQVIPDSNSAGGSLGLGRATSAAPTTPAVEEPVAEADTVTDSGPVNTAENETLAQPSEEVSEEVNEEVNQGPVAQALPTQPEAQRIQEEIEVDDSEVGPPLVVRGAGEISREEFGDDETQVPEVRPVEDRLVDAVETLEEVQQSVTTPLPPETRDCRTIIREQIRGNLPLEGAYRVMATYYQNCDVIDEVIDSQTVIPPLRVSSDQDANKIKVRALKAEDKERYINEHPYLRMVKAAGRPGPNCHDVLSRPPIFSFGAKPQYSHNRSNINLFRDQSQRPICHHANVHCDDSVPVTAMDCSGFVHAALRAAGLKVQKNNEHLDYSTSGFIESMKASDSCLKAPAFNANDTIKNGDIISLSEHHMIMVTSTAPDPLGVQKGIRSGDCSSIKRSDFKFTFMHSSSLRDMGLTHVSSEFPQASPTLLNNLLLLARETCSRHVRQQRGMEAMVKYNNPNRTLAVMRHVGDADPACKSDRPVRLQNEECVEDCLK